MKSEKIRESKVIQDVTKLLDYKSGNLIDLYSEAKVNWLDLGGWIESARGISGLSHIFFVKKHPLILFGNAENQIEIIEIFNNSWCMMQPKFLFVSSPGELSLFDLTQLPLKNSQDIQKRVLKNTKAIGDILEIFQDYTREKMESYDFSITNVFGGAESQFIKDLNTIRKELIDKGLNDKENGIKKLKYAHSIIGRSIFIKYLEDREILTKNYYLKVAGNNKEWIKLLNRKNDKPDIESNENAFYSKILKNKKFTFTLFKQLKEDFNGDMFSLNSAEEKAVKQEHLSLLSKFLMGDVKDDKLFFWAYNFKFIPIEIISSIYEEFYHEENVKDTKGTNYTPITLVEFLVSDTLTNDVLKKKPKILDPACGSGIFLVEAFKRIIRYNYSQSKKKLSFMELIAILKNQIFGIEINPEALKITSFSLYFALLNHLEPKDILENISQKENFLL